MTQIDVIHHPKDTDDMILNSLNPHAYALRAEEEQTRFLAGWNTIAETFNPKVLCENHIEQQQDILRLSRLIKRVMAHITLG